MSVFDRTAIQKQTLPTLPTCGLCEALGSRPHGGVDTKQGNPERLPVLLWPLQSASFGSNVEDSRKAS